MKYCYFEFRWHLMLCALTVVISLPSNAQVHLNARDKSIRYDLIMPAHSLYKVAFLDSMGKATFQGVIDHVTKIDTVKHEIDFINTVPIAAGRVLIDSSIDNYSGSLRYILATSPSTVHEFITYGTNAVVAHNTIKGLNTTKITPMPAGYFDDNSIWDILGIIPFKKGIRYQIDCYGTDSKTQVLIPYEIEYLFDEVELEKADGVARNMVLKVSYPGSTYLVWIDQRTHLITRQYGEGSNYSYARILL